MTITLSKAETAILVAAATRPGGLIEIPPCTKPGSRERLLGRFVRDDLATETADGAHNLTPAGYKAVGLRPPRKARAAASVIARVVIVDQRQASTGRPVTKLALIRELLSRPEGATLAELIAATGWLPHTTRAALSRIRSAGQALAKSARPDGKAAYRIEQATAPTVSDEPARTVSPATAAAAKRGRNGRRKAGADEVRAAA